MSPALAGRFFTASHLGFPSKLDGKASVSMQICVQSLGQEDHLEKEMATHSSIPAWRIPWTEELGGLQSVGLQKVGHNWQLTHTHTHTHTHTGMTDSNSVSKKIVPVTGSLALNLTCLVTLTHV